MYNFIAFTGIPIMFYTNGEPEHISSTGWDIVQYKFYMTFRGSS
jgi:hypothetical protein